METTLMIVTIIALALALGMSGVAWRLLRDNKHRTAARVHALQQLAEEEAPVDAEDWDMGFAASVPTNRPSPDIVFGATVAPPAAPPRRWLAIAAVGVVMAALVSGVYAVYRPAIAAGTGESSLDSAAPPAVRTGAPRPIELLSLRHQAEGDGTFTITGLVQNPIEGHAVRKVMAVAYLFDREGNYFASGKASLDFTMLQPGDESPFVIRVPGVSRVSRYRVGFRSEGGGIVAHVDRRGQLPGGTTGDAVGAPLRSPSTRRSDKP